MERRRLTTRLAFILALAFVLRAASAVGLQLVLEHRGRTYLVPGDAEGYWELAGDIAHLREYSIYTPPRRVLRMPGFPALLAVPISLFGDRQLPARLLLAGVGTLACAAVYWLGRSLWTPRIGLTAALIAAVIPTFVGFSPLILSETAFAAALTASLAPAAIVLRRLKSTAPISAILTPAALCGALIGVANYVRPSWLLAAPAIGLLAIVMAPRSIRSWTAAGVIVGAMLATLLPWAIRNQRVTGHFVLTTLWMGPSLYDGLNPGATGDSDMAFFDRENRLGELSEYDVDREYRDRAWAFARQHPGEAIRLAFVKLGRFWKPWPNADQFGHWTARLAVFLSSVPLWLVAAYGVLRTRPSLPALALTIGPIVYFSAVHMLFVGSLRYRLPAEYPLTVLAAVGWAYWNSGRMDPDSVREAV